MQAPLILRSSSLGDQKAAINHFSANYRVSTPISSDPGLPFKAGNITTNPNNSGLDHISRKTAFDYGFNQIYDDEQLQILDTSGNDPHENIVRSTGQATDTQKPIHLETAKMPAEFNSAMKQITNGAFSPQAAQLLCTIDVPKSEPDVESFAPIAMHRSSISAYPFASNGSFLHSFVDMESLKKEAYHMNDARRAADFEHEACIASTSAPTDYQHHHLLDFSSFPSFPTQADSHQALHTIKENGPSSSNHNLSCSHSAGTESTIGVAARGKPQTAPKRRSYYKCSSVKGCTARKQVERNPSDPMSIIITYTVEHNHAHASNAATSCSTSPTSTTAVDYDDPPQASPKLEDNQLLEAEEDKQMNGATDNTQIILKGRMDAMSEKSCEPISSEGNLKDMSNIEAEVMQISESTDIDYQVPKVVAVVEEQHHKKQCDHDVTVATSTTLPLQSSSSTTSSSLRLQCSASNNMKRESKAADDDFFAQLGELPDLFGKNSVWPPAGAHEPMASSSATAHPSSDRTGSTHNINIDPFDLYYIWP
ncbi:hypothetical protein L7F22_006514 [Adiantum nelumboides]|nr:hypothetical protein [Adiantum nelumboides]